MASHNQLYDLILSDCYFYSLLLISINQECEVLSRWVFTRLQPRCCFIRITHCGGATGSRVQVIQLVPSYKEHIGETETEQQTHPQIKENDLLTKLER